MNKVSKLTGALLALALVALGLTSPALAAKPLPQSKVYLNTATVEQLSTLPGVGEKLAGRILEYRQKAGGFKATAELLNVRGIGEKNLAKMQPYIAVGEPARADAAAVKKPAPPRSEAN
jgi:competence ComEA-like helix-hairpin-helix protein